MHLKIPWICTISNQVVSLPSLVGVFRWWRSDCVWSWLGSKCSGTLRRL